jgi:MATE family multidrug resistance protein
MTDAPLTFGGHALATLRLGLPIALSRAGLIGLFAVDTVAVGQRGGLELAALGVGTAPMSTLMLVCLGALQATMVLSARAIGEGDPRSVGPIFRAAVVNAVALGLLAGLLSLFAEPFFLLTGQAPDVAALAGKVALQFAWGLPAFLLFLAVNMTLETIGRPRVGVAIMAAANVANILFDGVFVLGWGGFFAAGGAEVAVATTSIVRLGMAVAAVVVLDRTAVRDGDPYGFRAAGRDWLQAAATLGGGWGRDLRRLGLPMGLGQGVESAAFSAMVLIAGVMGSEVVAAHQATMTVMSLIYMNAVGLGAAASIRVGAAMGRGATAEARRAGFAAIAAGGLLSGSCGLLVLALHGPLADAMIGDPVAAAIARQTLLMAGVLVAFDTMMGTAMGALRGLSDVWMPLWMQSAAFWFVSVPLALFLGLHLGFGAAGLYWGLGAGILTSFALLAPRFARVTKRAKKRGNP